MEAAIIARGEDPADYPILNSRPEIYSEYVWIYEAFLMLTSCRQHGMAGPQPLALSEILAFFQYRGISDPEEREEAMHLLQHLDRVYMADVSARSKANQKTPQQPSTR